MIWTKCSKRCCAGLTLHLESLRRRSPEQLAAGAHIFGNVIIDPDVKVGANCKIGPNVSIGALCKIGEGVRLSNCVLLHRVEVRSPHNTLPLLS